MHRGRIVEEGNTQDVIEHAASLYKLLLSSVFPIHPGCAMAIPSIPQVTEEEEMLVGSGKGVPIVRNNVKKRPQLKKSMNIILCLPFLC